ncbi:MAG: type II toxin-antitoxin system PemK/MazF family toxin [Methanosarcinales archaeon]
MKFDQGSIVLVDFSYSSLKASKLRPALLISNSNYNEGSLDVVVLKITSKSRDREWELEIKNDDLEEGFIEVEPSYVKRELLIELLVS